MKIVDNYKKAIDNGDEALLTEERFESG